MQFTFAFLGFLWQGLTMTAPLMGLLASIIATIGWWVGRREKWSFFDSIYWAMITASTVGYGDLRPTLRRTKVASILIAFTGLIFTGIAIAIAVEAAHRALVEQL